MERQLFIRAIVQKDTLELIINILIKKKYGKLY